MKFLIATVLIIIILYLCRDTPQADPVPACNVDFLDWFGGEHILPMVQNEARKVGSVLDFPNQLFNILPTHVNNCSITATALSLWYTVTLKCVHASTPAEISKMLTSALRRFIAKKYHLDISNGLVQCFSVTVRPIPETTDCDIIVTMSIDAYKRMYVEYQQTLNVVTY